MIDSLAQMMLTVLKHAGMLGKYMVALAWVLLYPH
jgi:hypothetical protein